MMCSDIQNYYLLLYFLFSTPANGFLKSPLCCCRHLVFGNVLAHAQTNCTYVVHITSPSGFKTTIVAKNPWTVHL